MAFALPDFSSLSLDEIPADVKHIPKFEITECIRGEKIGSGGFSSVYTVNYRGKTVVLKEMKDKPINMHVQKLFYKEAKLAYNIPDHKNIVKITAICLKEFAFMMDYVSFSFKPFKSEQRLHNLAEFLSFLDAKEIVPSFAPLFPKIARDIADGLSYLHSNNYVHRDLKPQNVLVSNQHYSDHKNFKNLYEENPIECKLTDFGESRSAMIQTNTIVQSRTDDCKERGTEVYHAPEIYEDIQDNKLTLDQLKCVDIWAVGMIYFSILNPDISFPYQSETMHLPKGAILHHLLKTFNRKLKPQFSDKHKKTTKNIDIEIIRSIYDECTEFDPRCRPTAFDISLKLQGLDQDKKETKPTDNEHITKRSKQKKDCNISSPLNAHQKGVSLATHLRPYQFALARPALLNKNVILVAPTGSGKTLVAAHIIMEHMKSGLSKKVAFIVHTKVLAEQQSKVLSAELVSLRIQCCTGESLDAPIQFIIPKADVLVVTAQVLLNGMDQPGEPIAVANFSLLVFDECHNCQKDHPFNNIMRKYRKEKRNMDESEKITNIAQVIGLTASIGTGGAIAFNKALSHALQICANLDAELIHATDKNEESLIQHINIPIEMEPHIVRCREKDVFRDIIEELMVEIEYMMRERALTQITLDEPDDMLTCNATKDSQMYENWVVGLKNEFPKLIDDGKVLRGVTACIEDLMLYNRALMLNRDARTTDALKFLLKRTEEKKRNISQFSDEEWTMLKKFTNRQGNLEKAADDPSSDNPLLRKLCELIVKEFRQNPHSRCLLFTTTIQSTFALKEWIEDTPEFHPLYLKPGRITGDKDSSDAERTATIENFRKGNHKLLVVTNVLEQGMDIAECNLVFRLNYVPSDTGHIQVKGRGRAKGSKSYLVASGSHGNFKNREKGNQIREDMMNGIVNALQNMPENEYKNYIRQLQKKDDQMLEEKELAEQRKKRQISQREFHLSCRKCLTYACSSNDVVRYKNSSFVVVNDGFRKMIKIAYYSKSNKISDTEEYVGKIYCDICGNDWGVWVLLEGHAHALIKIVGFLVTDTRTREQYTPKKWKNVPFVGSVEVVYSLYNLEQ